MSLAFFAEIGLFPFSFGTQLEVLLLSLLGGKRESKRGAFTQLRLDSYLAAKTVADLCADAQTEAVAVRIELFAFETRCLEVRLKQIGLVFVAYADPVVCNVNLNLVLVQH